MNALYPPKCALCGLIGRPAICEECFEEFLPVSNPLAGKLGPLDWQVCVYQYEGRAAQAVRRFKYDRVTSLADPLATLVAEALPICPEVDAIVPVPIHRSRKAWRGFNQSELLCQKLDAGLVVPALAIRSRKTKPQVGLSAQERMTNLDNAFQADPRVKGQRVLLVDDVVTTGWTAIACAETLKSAGAVEVGILALCGEQETPRAIPPQRLSEIDRPYPD